MATNRVTQVAGESLVDGTPAGRVTAIAAESLVDGTPAGLVTQLVVEALMDNTLVVATGRSFVAGMLG